MYRQADSPTAPPTPRMVVTKLGVGSIVRRAAWLAVYVLWSNRNPAVQASKVHPKCLNPRSFVPGCMYGASSPPGIFQMPCGGCLGAAVEGLDWDCG